MIELQVDERGTKEQAERIDLSVVCPFYNEEKILAHAIRSLLEQLSRLNVRWELIVVNDGSTDRGGAIAAEIAATDPRLRVFGYERNRGRGYGLRTGIAKARGAIIVTTEIDLSWGDDIVARLYEAIQTHPAADIVVASPHLPGGGYRNVPAKRVFLSRFGNWVIRACMSNVATMNTGMTRAYRRDVIRSLPLEEDGKEFHLEVILKAQAFGYRFYEIPALLEWKDYKHEGKRVGRKSSTRVNKLVVTHSLYSLFANPIRYVWGLSAIALLIAIGFFVAGAIRFAMGLVSVYMLIISLTLVAIALMLFAFGLLAQQTSMIRHELWRVRKELSDLRSGQEAQATATADGSGHTGDGTAVQADTFGH